MSRWKHLVRHGLIGATLVQAGTARAELCSVVDERTITAVIGVQVSPKLSLVGGIEGRQCLSDRTEALLRVEIGGAAPRLIGGARVRPFESDTGNEEYLGLETGVVIDRHAKFGVHLAATYGMNAAYAALQAQVQPSSNGDAQRWTLIGALAPWAIFPPDGMTVEGRPLVVAGHMVRPRVLRRPDVRDRELAAVRDHFISSAQLELSSVWTFLRLAAELAAVGAPIELVTAALDAADDEVRHAEQCAGLAGGLTLGALADDAARPRFTTRTQGALATLAAEAWLEGCLNETAAAEEARMASELARGPACDILGAIARDEQGHAELSWRVLAWATSVAPGLVRATISALPPYAVNDSHDAIDPALAQYGVPREDITCAARAHAASVAGARLAALV